MKKLWQYFLNNKATVFTILGSVGVVFTGILGVRAGKKSVEPDAKWTVYIPPVVVGGATITAIVLSHTISAKQIAALTATCSYLTLNRDELEKAIRERYGDEALKEIKSEVDEKMANQMLQTRVAEETGKGDVLCYEGYSGRWFRSSWTEVNRDIKRFDRRWRNKEYLCLNDLYSELGIEESHFGNQFGWPANPDYYSLDDPIVIETTYLKKDEIKKKGTQMDKLNEDCIIIDIYTYPMDCWMEV